MNCVQEDKSDIYYPRKEAEVGAPSPLEATPPTSKRSYSCCWRIQQLLPSPSPDLHEHSEPSRSDLKNSDHSSYPVGKGKSGIPDRSVRRGDSKNEHTIARQNVEPKKGNLLLAQASDNVLDILLWKADYGQIRRFLVLELDVEVNVMDDEVYRYLNLEKEPCDLSTPLNIPGQANLKPTGKVSCRWCIWGNTQTYLTSFLVVSGCDFDVMIGRHSIMEHQIHQ